MLPQTKVPIYGRDHISSRKAQAMKQAKHRTKLVSKVGLANNMESSPLSLDKLDPEFVSEVEITKMHTEWKTDSAQREVFASLIKIWSSFLNHIWFWILANEQTFALL